MRIAVVGAGVIGVSTAHALIREGHDVTIFDRQAVGSGASCGNAGAFAFADILPIATPGILRQAPKWLLDPLGPLAIRPAYALRILPWLLRFLRASMPDRYAAARDAQAALMRQSQAALERLIDTTQAEALVRREGQLQLYETADNLRAAQPGLDERAAAGIRFDILTGTDEIAAIQPGVSPRFTRGVFTPDWINTTDPLLWVQTLAEQVTRAGGRIERQAVHAIIPGAPEIQVDTAAGRQTFDRVILAAGAQSGTLLAPLGLRLPLESERGYNTTLPAGAFDLRTQLTFSNHGFVLSRIGQSVRVGGAAELGGLDLPPNMKRAEALLTRAKSFLPDLRTEGGTQWMGHRPSMPDSLPVIGAAPGLPGLILAFGHGHLGLTQSAGTAEIVADLVAARPARLDLAPYRPGRFLKGAP